MLDSCSTEYLTFDVDHFRSTTKTRVYVVANKEVGVMLGEIQWYGPWRRYVFHPNRTTLYDVKCLNDIGQFLNELMLDRKKTKELE
jgi:hypothetical protein